MLKFFKSKPPAAPARPAKAANPRAPTASSAGAAPSPTPPPLPEVSEGNEESDWAIWEDSVAFQDSQMPSGFSELDAVKTHDEKPKKKGGDPDPFATVGKRGS